MVVYLPANTTSHIQDLYWPAWWRWTNAPAESDEDDAVLVAALKARWHGEDDEDNADDSKAVVPWMLCQAQTSGEDMKIR